MDRPVRIVIPFKLQGAKSRLSSMLSPEERRLLALSMLEDVLSSLSTIGSVVVLSKNSFDGCMLGPGVDIVESDLELNDALNSFIEGWQRQDWPSDLLIVMADLALLRAEDIKGILQTPGEVVFSPGLGGGTNMILIRSSRFRTCYHGLSFSKHLDLAKRLGLKAEVYSSYRAGCDIDEPDDLAEILIHGHNRTISLLKELGFTLSEHGRAVLLRRAKNEDSNESD